MANKDREPDDSQESRADPDFVVVGIGASAGGVKALQELFGTIPAGIGMAFVVIIHLKADANTNLASILQNVTGLNVVTIEDGVDRAEHGLHSPRRICG